MEGKRGPKIKVGVPAGSRESYTLQIEIGPERVLVKDAQGKELDRDQRPNPSSRSGFGEMQRWR